MSFAKHSTPHTDDSAGAWVLQNIQPLILMTRCVGFAKHSTPHTDDSVRGFCEAFNSHTDDSMREFCEAFDKANYVEINKKIVY